MEKEKIICKVCGREKPDEEFRFLTNPKGLVNQLKTCKSCEREKAKNHYREKILLKENRSVRENNKLVGVR